MNVKVNEVTFNVVIRKVQSDEIKRQKLVNFKEVKHSLHNFISKMFSKLTNSSQYSNIYLYKIKTELMAQ